MLVWVASYPRSGNTLTLQTLFDVFGVNRICTIHEPTLWLKGRYRSGTYEVPDELIGLEQPELLEALRERPEPFFIKSHRLRDSADTARALYVVRDGRDVHVSYAHWMEGREFRVKGETTGPGLSFSERLDTVVSRRSWSRHVREWRTRSAPTAILRYEDLIEDSAGVIRRACDVLGVPLPEPSGDLTSFSELQERNPTQHRRGKVGSWHEEMAPATERSFWSVHGEEMEALGYSDRLVAQET